MQLRRAPQKNPKPSVTLSNRKPLARLVHNVMNNIQQISNNIDHKLIQLEQQLTQLKAKLASDGASEQRLKDIAALEEIKHKLLKSRTIMWQAHDLGHRTDRQRLRNKRWLGIGLCLVSAIGFIILAFIVFTH